MVARPVDRPRWGLRPRALVVPGLLAALLALSAATHLTNPVLAHDIIMDEGIYVNRALRILEGGPLQNPEGRYAHPFFGWVFLAAILPLLGYPPAAPAPGGPCNPSCAMMLAPRLLAGALAVADTLLVFAIGRRLYGSPWPGLAAAALFAVTPATWFFSAVLLDTLMVFWLLLGLALLLAARDQGGGHRRHALVALSGIAAGLALITKLPALALLPAFLAALLPDLRRGLRELYRAARSRSPLPAGSPLGAVLLWLAAAAAPLFAWLLYASFRGELGLLIAGVLDQGKRATLGDVAGSYEGDRFTLLYRYLTDPLNNYGFDLWHVDPLLLLLGGAATAFAFLRLDRVLVAWVAPYLAFLLFTVHKQFWFVEPLIPALVISVGGMAWVLYRWAAGLPTPGGGVVRPRRAHAANGGGRGPRPAVVGALTALLVALLLLVQGASLAPQLGSTRAAAQHAAALYVLEHAPPGTTVLSSAAFDWILRHYRGDLNALNYYMNRFASFPLGRPGEPVPYTTATIADARGGVVYRGNSATGLHALSLPPGSYTVVAESRGRTLGPFTVDLRGSARLTVVDGEGASNATVASLPGPGPRLEVVVLEGPRPFWLIVDPVLRWDATYLRQWLGGFDDGARIDAIGLLPWAPALATALALTDDLRVFAGNDALGTFHLDLAPGRYAIDIWTKDHGFVGSYAVALGGPALVDLAPDGAHVAAAPGPGVTLRIHDAAGGPRPWAWIEVRRTYTLTTFTSEGQTVEVRAYDPAGDPGGTEALGAAPPAGPPPTPPVANAVIEHPFTTLYSSGGGPRPGPSPARGGMA